MQRRKDRLSRTLVLFDASAHQSVIRKLHEAARKGHHAEFSRVLDRLKSDVETLIEVLHSRFRDEGDTL